MSQPLGSAHARPAIFFDCDGVLNEEPGDPGVVTPDDVKTIPGAGAALRRARAAGLLTVAVTNRPQVAKGLITLEGLDHIFSRLEALLARMAACSTESISVRITPSPAFRARFRP